MKIIKKAKERTAEDNRQLRDTVTNIIDHVCREGDQALREYSEKFDGFVRDAFRVSCCSIPFFSREISRRPLIARAAMTIPNARKR